MANNEDTSKDEAAFCQTQGYPLAEKAALRLIARAEQNTTGLKRKLEKKGYDKATVDEVIGKLCSLQLLDDSRFARLWLSSRLHLASSPRRLLVSLRNRGLDRDDAEGALKNALDDETEYALLLRFVKKHKRKFAKQEDSDYSLKHFLKNEGFSRDVIQRYLEERDKQ